MKDNLYNYDQGADNQCIIKTKDQIVKALISSITLQEDGLLRYEIFVSDFNETPFITFDSSFDEVEMNKNDLIEIIYDDDSNEVVSCKNLGQYQGA